MAQPIDEYAALAVAASRVSELIRAADLATPVPNLGRWKIRDVVAHLGGVHRWATRIVTTRSMDGPSFTKSKLDGLELCDWFDDGVDHLVQTLRTNPAEDPCPNFNPGSPNTVAWWSRRQMHETIVHCWDIERSVGSTTPIDPVVATDGIEEFLDVYVRTRGKQTLTAPLVLATTKPAQAWTLSPAERVGRVNVVSGRTPNVTTELNGRPEPLLLVLWGRIDLADAPLETIGDATIAASLTAQP